MTFVTTEINHIWKEYHDQLLDFIRKKVKDSADAEDILQEVFIKILSKIDTLKDSDKLKSWLFQITRNTIIDHYREAQKGKKVDFTFSLEEDETTDNSSMKAAESWIGLYVNDLPENYREAVILSELKGLSIAKIAENLNISYTNARARVNRGRQALKKNLTDCCTFHVDVYGNIIDYHANPPNCKNC
jgi:RNA polymerase sigma-70 factor (ECF subfamily)